MNRRRPAFALASFVLVAVLAQCLVPAQAQAQTVNRDDILYIVPYWYSFLSSTDAAVAAEMADMKSRLGPEGPYVKFGVSAYVFVSMDDWNVDLSNPAALRAALASTTAQIDSLIAKSRAQSVPVPISFAIQTAIRERYDPVQRASEGEDIRSMQWYADNAIAPGWWTHSRYARKARAVQEAYIRELGKIVANRMRLYPDIVVAASGDGEVEMALERDPIYADYSPFAVAEFRDWLRLGGQYATGAAYAGQGYTLGARYAGDATPGQDTNGDGHTLNGDFGRDFATWDLLHFNWTLTDPAMSGDPNTIPLATYSGGGFVKKPGTIAKGFDAPRTPQADNSDPWWNLWVLFKQTLLQHHNTDFAKWMTTSVDPETGATIAPARWYSNQMPADYSFNGSPEYPIPRFLSSMSSWWTGDTAPYGSVGITAFNLDWTGYPPPAPPNYVAYTLKWVAPKIAERDRRWGIIEWNPGLLPYDTGVTNQIAIYRDEMAVIEQYRPSLLQPYVWGHPTNKIQNTGFETTMKEMVARLKDGMPSNPKLDIEAPAANSRQAQPFTLTGWAVDLGKIRGPGRGPGIDTVQVYAYLNPGSGTPPVLVGTAAYGSARPTLAAQYGTQFTNSGFSMVVQGLAPGRYELEAVGHSTVTLESTVLKRVALDIVTPMQATPSALTFGATKAGATGAFVATTAPQHVSVAYQGAWVPRWTVSADQPWIVITNGTGTGAGLFTVSILDPGNAVGGASTLKGTITIAAPNANALTTVAVRLTIDQNGGAATAPPFGLVDTPAQGATGIVGTIGVTGWALDDVGVATVRLYRNCLAFEPAANCASVAGRDVVYVGDATMVTGARPDVEGIYPTYPQASRAAWGYLLMTNLLPHIPKAQMFGGQGTLTLSVLATDVEGKQTWLGRARDNTTPTTITMANDTIAKPFGAIDTPAQGETVSGTIPNFGWALTPDADTVAGVGDTLIPTDGSTIHVYVDGVPRSGVTFNQCRGTTVAGPVPAGVWCNDDVASIFGHPTPQPMFTPRDMNLTLHRNLDEGRGAIGAYLLDTTTLSNGVHTIMWGVVDSDGRNDGIGSRYFTVMNAGGDSFDSPATGLAQDRARAGRDSLLVGRDFPAAGDAGSKDPAYGSVAVDAAVLETLTVAQDDIRGRTGIDPWAPLVVVPEGDDGARHVRIPDLGRLELGLGGKVDAGHLVANGTLRDLPPGSHLERETGVFTWAPGVGYVGTYRLAFVRDGEQIPVDVTIRPIRAPREGESEVRMAVDVPRSGETVRGALRIAGWALDPQAAIGSGIGAVHVWAVRVETPDLASPVAPKANPDPVFLGAAALGGARADVAATFGSQFTTAAFDLTVPALPAGRYDVTAYVWSTRTGQWQDARTVRIDF